MYVVRVARPEDDDRVAIINAQMTAFLRQFYRPSKEARRNRKNLLRCLTRLVVCRNDQVVGTAEYHLSGEALRILALAVHQDHRGHGAARALISHLMELAKALHIRVLSTSTLDITGNVPIFEKLGFIITKRVKDDFYVCDSANRLTEVYFEIPIK